MVGLKINCINACRKVAIWDVCHFLNRYAAIFYAWIQEITIKCESKHAVQRSYSLPLAGYYFMRSNTWGEEDSKSIGSRVSIYEIAFRLHASCYVFSNEEWRQNSIMYLFFAFQRIVSITRAATPAAPAAPEMTFDDCLKQVTDFCTAVTGVDWSGSSDKQPVNSPRVAARESDMAMDLSATHKLAPTEYITISEGESEHSDSDSGSESDSEDGPPRSKLIKLERRS